MMHYHGTPLTPRSELVKMAGKNLCVSFANPGDADWALANAQQVLWDNGAFTFHRLGAVRSESLESRYYKKLSAVAGPCFLARWTFRPTDDI